MKRFLFYCKNCGFEYSGGSEEPCSCSLCGTVNDCCYVEELEKEAEEWTKDHSGLIGSYKFVKYDYDSMQKAYLAGAEPREKRIEELEKENAELKGIKDVATLIRANNDTVTTLMQLNDKLVSKSQQLTKAKEIIRKFMKYEINEYDGSLEIHFEELKKQAEQFLSEVEK